MRVDVELGVEGRDERRVGVGIVAVAHARDDRPLGPVRRADHTGGHTGDDTGALEDVARVHPRYRRGTRPDAGDDLVGDGAEVVGPLQRGDLVVALAPEEHDFVAGFDRRITDVDHELVHRHDPGDRVPAATDQHFPAGEPQVAGHAVGVAGGHRRDPCLVGSS